MEEQVRHILKALGEDPNREGLLKTPQRVAEALAFLTQGYRLDPGKVINDALFTEDYEEMIVQKDIDFFSLCEHHLLPFFGKAHVAYIPHHKIVGISKLARLVDVYARRLQVQERLTTRSLIPSWKNSILSVSPWSSKRSICACECAAWRNRIR